MPLAGLVIYRFFGGAKRLFKQRNKEKAKKDNAKTHPLGAFAVRCVDKKDANLKLKLQPIILHPKRKQCA